MKAIERILVICDPSMQVTPALRKGIELARKAGAEVHLCIFDHDKAIDKTAHKVSADVARVARKAFLESKLEWLDAQAVDCAAHHLRVECDAIWAPRIEEALVNKVLDIDADIVVKDTSTRSGLERHILPPPDWKVIRFCPVPLLLVKNGSERLPHRILCGIDAWEDVAGPTSLNVEVVKTALQMGLYGDSDVHVASVAPLIPRGGLSYKHITAAIDEAVHEHAEAFRRFVHEQQIPADRTHSLTGEAAQMLNELAVRMECNLLVIGSHFRSGWTRLFLGSTAEALLGIAKCDVLLIKPEGTFEEIQRALKLIG